MLFLFFILQYTLCSNIAAYWGQNAGSNQQSLGHYCSTSPAEIIILSFLNNFPQLELNFANQCSQTYGDGLLHCSQIAQDIKSCQSQGKIILLSLGGATGNYGFSSDQQASSFATTLWNKFGGGSDNERPFDDAIVDGFDFDIENKQQTGYVTLANQLKNYFSKSSKKFYLSAAPQCPYPDESVGDLMSQVDLDFAFIQFYNNYCSIDKQFNWDTWNQYANNKNIKLYLGIAGSSSSAGSGYVDLSSVQNAISSISKDSSFGGVSIWDISSIPNNFINGIQQALQGGGNVAPTLSTSSIIGPISSIPIVHSSIPSNSVIYSPIASAIPTTTTTSSSTGGFLNWLGGLFNTPTTTSNNYAPAITSSSNNWIQSVGTPQIVTQAPSIPTTTAVASPPQPSSSSSQFNWFGLFGGATSTSQIAPTTPTPTPQIAAVEVTTYITLTTTVSPPAYFKRDNIIDSSEATSFHPGYLLIMTFITFIFIL
ncbi:CHT1 [Candida pseudojiufengensis]|uniref:CHT1 n=1 Tax=Candida pseudojiufengensis TaxID=497109 RepID=UPI002225A9C4|nr:CHT1 [Candida pseudojiufengensis]KAI5966699.1 CHT1 [Candida pseudojiufengensis]